MPRYHVETISLSNDVELDHDVLHATDTDSMEEAADAARAAAEAHQEFGWDDARGGWWGRNAGGVVTLFRPAQAS